MFSVNDYFSRFCSNSRLTFFSQHTIDYCLLQFYFNNHKFLLKENKENNTFSICTVQVTYTSCPYEILIVFYNCLGFGNNLEK